MTLPEEPTRKCVVDGLIRPVSVMTKYAEAPKSTSGARKYPEMWYCNDKNHSLTMLARIAARTRP